MVRGMHAGCARYEVASTLSLPALRASTRTQVDDAAKDAGRREGERGTGRGDGERVEGTGTGAGVGKTGRNDPRPSSAAVIVARNQTSRRRRDRRRANPSSWAVCDCFFLVTAASAGRLNPRRHRLAWPVFLTLGPHCQQPWACWSNAEDAEATDLPGRRGGWKVAAFLGILMWRGAAICNPGLLCKRTPAFSRKTARRALQMAERLLLCASPDVGRELGWDREQLVVAGDWREVTRLGGTWGTWGTSEGAWRRQPRDAHCRWHWPARHGHARREARKKAPDRLPRCLGGPGNVKSAAPAGGLPFFSSRAPPMEASCGGRGRVSGERGE